MQKYSVEKHNVTQRLLLEQRRTMDRGRPPGRRYVLRGMEYSGDVRSSPLTLLISLTLVTPPDPLSAFFGVFCHGTASLL